MSGDCPRIVASRTGCDCVRPGSPKWTEKDFGVHLKELSREELEIEFYNLHTKNQCLSKAMKDNMKQMKRLNKVIKKNEEERKRCLSPTKQLYEDRISQLEQANNFLQDKVLVLRHQLQSHSRLHAKAHRNISHHTRSIHSTKTSQTHLSQLPTNVSENINQDVKNDSNEDLNVDLVENENRILQLQSELEQNPNDASRVADNIELIKLRRLVKRQSAQLSTLNAHLEVSDKELEQLRTSYNQASLENDQVLKQLMVEKQRLREMQNELIELGNLKQDIKILQEQVRDLKNERTLLRSNNDKLLEIASGKAEEDNSQQKQDTDKYIIERDSKEETEKIYSNSKKPIESAHYLQKYISEGSYKYLLSNIVPGKFGKQKLLKELIVKTYSTNFYDLDIDYCAELSLFKAFNHRISPNIFADQFLRPSSFNCTVMPSAIVSDNSIEDEDNEKKDGKVDNKNVPGESGGASQNEVGNNDETVDSELSLDAAKFVFVQLLKHDLQNYDLASNKSVDRMQNETMAAEGIDSRPNSNVERNDTNENNEAEKTNYNQILPCKQSSSLIDYLWGMIGYKLYLKKKFKNVVDKVGISEYPEEVTSDGARNKPGYANNYCLQYDTISISEQSSDTNNTIEGCILQINDNNYNDPDLAVVNEKPSFDIGELGRQLSQNIENTSHQSINLDPQLESCKFVGNQRKIESKAEGDVSLNLFRSSISPEKSRTSVESSKRSEEPVQNEKIASSKESEETLKNVKIMNSKVDNDNSASNFSSIPALAEHRSSSPQKNKNDLDGKDIEEENSHSNGNSRISPEKSKTSVESSERSEEPVQNEKIINSKVENNNYSASNFSSISALEEHWSSSPQKSNNDLDDKDIEEENSHSNGNSRISPEKSKTSVESSKRSEEPVQNEEIINSKKSEGTLQNERIMNSKVDNDNSVSNFSSISALEHQSSSPQKSNNDSDNKNIERENSHSNGNSRISPEKSKTSVESSKRSEEPVQNEEIVNTKKSEGTLQNERIMNSKVDNDNSASNFSSISALEHRSSSPQKSNNDSDNKNIERENSHSNGNSRISPEKSKTSVESSKRSEEPVQNEEIVNSKKSEGTLQNERIMNSKVDNDNSASNFSSISALDHRSSSPQKSNNDSDNKNIERENSHSNGNSRISPEKSKTSVESSKRSVEPVQYEEIVNSKKSEGTLQNERIMNSKVDNDNSASNFSSISALEHRSSSPQKSNNDSDNKDIERENSHSNGNFNKCSCSFCTSSNYYIFEGPDSSNVDENNIENLPNHDKNIFNFYSVNSITGSKDKIGVFYLKKMLCECNLKSVRGSQTRDVEHLPSASCNEEINKSSDDEHRYPETKIQFSERNPEHKGGFDEKPLNNTEKETSNPTIDSSLPLSANEMLKGLDSAPLLTLLRSLILKITGDSVEEIFGPSFGANSVLIESSNKNGSHTVESRKHASDDAVLPRISRLKNINDTPNISESPMYNLKPVSDSNSFNRNSADSTCERSRSIKRVSEPGISKFNPKSKQTQTRNRKSFDKNEQVGSDKSGQPLNKMAANSSRQNSNSSSTSPKTSPNNKTSNSKNFGKPSEVEKTHPSLIDRLQKKSVGEALEKSDEFKNQVHPQEHNTPSPNNTKQNIKTPVSSSYQSRYKIPRKNSGKGGSQCVSDIQRIFQPPINQSNRCVESSNGSNEVCERGSSQCREKQDCPHETELMASLEKLLELLNLNAVRNSNGNLSADESYSLSSDRRMAFDHDSNDYDSNGDNGTTHRSQNNSSFEQNGCEYSHLNLDESHSQECPNSLNKRLRSRQLEVSNESPFSRNKSSDAANNEIVQDVHGVKQISDPGTQHKRPHHPEMIIVVGKKMTIYKSD